MIHAQVLFAITRSIRDASFSSEKARQDYGGDMAEYGFFIGLLAESIGFWLKMSAFCRFLVENVAFFVGFAKDPSILLGQRPQNVHYCLNIAG
jgi:hypothetical protein